MGFDIHRFPNGVDEELICMYSFDNHAKGHFSSIVLYPGSICAGVLEEPVQAPTCEHAFCQVNETDRTFSDQSSDWVWSRVVLWNGYRVLKRVQSIEQWSMQPT